MVTQLPPEFLQALQQGVAPPPVSGGGINLAQLPPPPPAPPGPNPNQAAMPPLGMAPQPAIPSSPFSPGLAPTDPNAQPQPPGMVDPTLLALLQGPPQGVLERMKPKRQQKGYRPKPRPEDVAAAVERDRLEYGTLLVRMSRDVALYRRHSSGLPHDFDPQKETPYRSPALATLVNKISNMFAGAEATYAVPFTDTPQQKSSQAIENFLYDQRKRERWWYGRKGGQDLQRDEFFYLLLHGRVAACVLPDLDDEAHPYSISLVDPATCFPVFGEGKDGMIRMSRRYQATVSEVITKFGVDQKTRDQIAKKLGEDSFQPASSFLSEKGEVVEYWDTWWRSLTFMGVEIMPLTEHGYGFCPWVYVPATGEPVAMATPLGRYFADTTTGEMVTNIGRNVDLSEKGVSVFHYLIETHQLKEALMTILYAEVEKAANQPTITYTAPHLTGDEPPPLNTKRGGNNQRILNLQRVEGMPTSPRPTDFSPLYQTVTQDYIDGSVPPGAFGNQSGSNISGTTMDALLGSVKDVILPYAKAWETFQSLKAEMMLYHYRDRIAPLRPVTTPVRGNYGYKGAAITLRTSDIDLVGCYVDVTIGEVGTDTLLERSRTAVQQVGAGLWSQRKGMEYTDVKDPDQMFGEIIEEKSIQHPKMMEGFITPMNFIQRGEPDLATMWNMLVVVPEMGMIPGQPGSPVGAAPPPGTPPVSPQEQAPGGPAPGQGRGPAPAPPGLTG